MTNRSIVINLIWYPFLVISLYLICLHLMHYYSDMIPSFLLDNVLVGFIVELFTLPALLAMPAICCLQLFTNI